jgi:hypothetical protein
MPYLVPDWGGALQLIWGMDQNAPADGWIYAEAKNGEGQEDPENHSCLTVNGFRIEIACGGCMDSGVAHHASVFIPVRKNDTFIGENGSQTRLVFLPIRD